MIQDSSRRDRKWKLKFYIAFLSRATASLLKFSRIFILRGKYVLGIRATLLIMHRSKTVCIVL